MACTKNNNISFIKPFCKGKTIHLDKSLNDIRLVPDKEKQIVNTVRTNAHILWNLSSLEHVEYLKKPMVTLKADNFHGRILNMDMTGSQLRKNVMFSSEQTFNFK